MKFNSISEIKKANQVINNHFFDRDTMEFFNSKVETGVLKGCFFITSEIAPNETIKRFTLRMVESDGSIETIGPFHWFDTKLDAKSFLRTLPGYFPEAYETAHNNFNADKMQTFVDYALTEPTNRKDKSFDKNTFCGSCMWVVLNYKDIDKPFLEIANKMYKEQL